jgi:hypothetical protein
VLLLVNLVHTFGESRVDKLKAKKFDISMDGKSRWMDNVFIERL